MPLEKKRWIILAVCCLINFCIGTCYAWSVFSTPLAVRLGEILGREMTAADLAIAFTVSNAGGPLSMVAGGTFNDRLGPRWVIFIAGVVFSGGMMLTGLAKSMGMLILGFGLLVGLAGTMAYGCTVSTAVKFFPDKRGLIGGVAVASFGVSSVLIPPIATAMIDGMGVAAACVTLGAVFLVIICTGAFLIPQCPPGYMPAGWTPPAPKPGAALPEDKTWRQMMKSPIFYVMLLILMCGAVSGLMAVSQAKPMALNMIGMSPALATAAVSVLALFNALGRVLCGYISDRVGRINTFTGVFVLAICGMLCLYFAGTGATAQFFAGICIVGFCFGSFMGVFPGFTADRFGPRNNSVNYGIMFAGFAAAGIIGPTIVGNVYKAQGSYRPAFLVAAGLGALGLLLTVLYRRLAGREG